jgi:hypothetical protein
MRGFLFFIAFYRNIKAQKNLLMILSPAIAGLLVLGSHMEGSHFAK